MRALAVREDIEDETVRHAIFELEDGTKTPVLGSLYTGLVDDIMEVKGKGSVVFS